MSRRIIVAIVGFAVYFLSLADAHADRLFRRSTGEVIAEGKKLDMTVQLKEKGGKIKESATFENLKFTHIYKAYKDYKD
jgi:hypothetical protein